MWPTAPFISIKLFQGICCSIVLSVMAFFSYHLRKDNYQIPWQFFSLATLVNNPTFQSVGQKLTIYLSSLLFPFLASSLSELASVAEHSTHSSP